MAEKSEGMLQYERGISDLEARIERGEINSKEEVSSEYVRILGDAAPDMSEEELSRIERQALIWRAALVKELARRSGHTAPDNDPEGPN